MIKIERGNVELNGNLKEMMAEILVGVASIKEEMLSNEDKVVCELLVECFNDTLERIGEIKTLEEMKRYMEE